MTVPVSNSLVLTRTPPVQLSSSGLSLKPSSDIFPNATAPTTLLLGSTRSGKLQLTASARQLTVQAVDGGRPSTASVFVGGFVLGGLTVGALGCVFAPQIAKALTGSNRKELMRKLPNFIYDEEKELEKTRKVLTEKIAELNTAIDHISARLQTDNVLNGGNAVHKRKEDIKKNKT